ncbi:hypothetical protein BDW59DRAFT_166890 [Aspergillus cavernicola]|uniref:MYND-type domain-containing protein n=1 Tax=Aspergillus cavernicola TaxID=176166 RepID=A0ABR4HKE5_9EURO
MARVRFPCVACGKESRVTCANCKLIYYCDSGCRLAHWPQHRPDCESPLNKTTWQPDWVSKGHIPKITWEDLEIPHDAKSYLWGNVPALDVLQLRSHEGEMYDKDLRLLFPASGDLRHVVTTIARLPDTYQKALKITINDCQISLVARNLILLLIALTVEDAGEAIDCMIHYWYSAFLRRSHLDILQKRIRPHICQFLNNPTLTPDTNTIMKYDCGLQISVKCAFWDKLLFHIDETDVTPEDARQTRISHTLSKERIDHQDWIMNCLSPSHRVARNKFLEDGLLLPFGSPRDEFCIPNPGFFFAPDEWPIDDDADPLKGWPSKGVAAADNGPAKADIYGKLFRHIRGTLRAFHTRLRKSEFSFDLYHCDATALADRLPPDPFDRIEVSNIADNNWLGIKETLGITLPLLRTPAQNPHATLITLFMSATSCTMPQERVQSEISPDSPTFKLLLKYIPFKRTESTKLYDPLFMKLFKSTSIVMDHEPWFEQYMTANKFRDHGKLLGGVMKDENSLTDKWPASLKLKPRERGAQKEFDRCIGSGMYGQERYVEWKRVSLPTNEIEPSPPIVEDQVDGNE